MWQNASLFWVALADLTTLKRTSDYLTTGEGALKFEPHVLIRFTEPFSERWVVIRSATKPIEVIASRSLAKV